MLRLYNRVLCCYGLGPKTVGIQLIIARERSEERIRYIHSLYLGH